MPKCKYYISNINDGNLSLGVGDDEIKVIQNRANLMKKLGFSLDDLVFPIETSSNIVLSVPEKPNKVLYGDALVTNKRGIVIGIYVADCIPIILYDDINFVVGVVHCGWRGTSKGILSKAIKKLLKLGADIKNVKAVIGPGISGKNYNVHREVLNHFRNKVITIVGRGEGLLDLKKEDKIELLEAGILRKNIEIMGIDTYKDHNYFSHRWHLANNAFPRGDFGVFAWISE